MPQLSVVIPVFNEKGNLQPLIDEVERTLAGRMRFEVVVVDDGSDDGTEAEAACLASDRDWLRVETHPRNRGQSAAIRTGVLAARAPTIAVLDGDGQNDPADIPALLALYEQAISEGGSPDARPLGMVAGQRAKRRDSWVKRRSSRLANGLRRRLLDDDCVDTGCGLKLITADCFRALPYFDHIHRFLPALAKREGYAVRFVDVNHRPRARGQSKYGVMNRLFVGIVDLRGVMWLNRRSRRPSTIEEL
jgi:dolichol-phosphate mannosyltransferase